MKKSVSFVMAALMAASLATTGSMTVLADGDVTITVFNSKTEIESQLEEAAAQYSEEKGVNVEIYYSNDPVTAHMATRYASNDPYTLSMVDAKDIYSMGEEHAVDHRQSALMIRFTASRFALRHVVLSTMQTQSRTSQAKISIRPSIRHWIPSRNCLISW